MSFLRIIQHLLPRSQAFSLASGKTIRAFFEGLTGAFEDAREAADLAYLDLFPATTRRLREWEDEFGLVPNSNETARRLALASAWQATGGQDPSYLQGLLQTAGFDVYVHEWWAPEDGTTVSGTLCKLTRADAPTVTISGTSLADAGSLTLRVYRSGSLVSVDIVTDQEELFEFAAFTPPYTLAISVLGISSLNVDFPGTLADYRIESDLYRAQRVPATVRDPRDYTEPVRVGTVRCGLSAATCRANGTRQNVCNRFLANDPGYLVNKNLTRVAPPNIPSDPLTWRHFWYVAGEDFDDTASIPANRREEFERLILKCKPTQTWVVTRLTYTVDGALTTEAGDFLITESGDSIAA